MFSLIGLGTAGLQDHQAVPDQALIGYEGLLAQYPRSASAFRQMLSDYFEIPVEVQPFAGSWRPLDPGFRTGVKVAVVDATGKVVATTTIYPHEPAPRWDEALATLGKLAVQHRVDFDFRLHPVFVGAMPREPAFFSEVKSGDRNHFMASLSANSRIRR